MLRFCKVWLAVALLVAAWLLWMTLRPNATVAQELTVLSDPVAAQGVSRFWFIDIAGNIAVFVPLGAAMALARIDTFKKRCLWGLLAGALLSICIECGQLFLPSRVSSVEDLALNTLGAALGAFFAALLGQWVWRDS